MSTPSAPATAPATREDVGAVLRRLRTGRGLSMRQLARMADLSQPFLSNIENGRSMPSIATLYRLADALGVSAQELLPAAEITDMRAVPAGAVAERPAQRTSDHPDAPLSTLLVGGPEQLLEVRRVSIPPSTPPEDWFEHPGEEFLHLLEGALFVEFRDGRSETLGPGDSLWYFSSVAHRWSTCATSGAEVMIVNGRVPTGYSGDPD